MSEETRDLIIRRILVALDESPHSQAALEAAADLAARFRAELQGLFVEDVNLLRLAELPFTQEVGLFSPSRRRLDAQGVERQLRVQARRVHRALIAAAERAQVRWSFRVARGAIPTELLAAASGVDLIILGKAGWSLARRRRLGSTARTVAFRAPSLTLILQEGTRLGTPVVAVYDGSALARRALIAAAALAKEDEGALVVILADGPDAVRQLQEETAGWLGERAVGVRYHSLARTNASKLAHVVRTEGCGTFVLPARSELLKDEGLLALLDEVESPVLLVR
jgi:nucleotide-binding universal stress UspA family protein